MYRGSTVLFITHRLGSLRHADRILVMHQGSLVEQGTHSELMDLGGRYAPRQQEAGQSNLSKPDPNDGQLVPLAHQVRYRAPPGPERCNGRSSATWLWLHLCRGGTD